MLSRIKNAKRSAVVAVTAGAALVATAGVAFAAVLLFGFGNVSAEATEIEPLTITNVSLTAPLVPGATVGSKGIVQNSNDFPVTVKTVIVRAEGLAATGAGCDSGSIHPIGTWNANHGTGVGAGWATNLPESVTVPANGSAWVTVAEAVKQDAGATAMCGFNAKIAVKAYAGN